MIKEEKYFTTVSSHLVNRHLPRFRELTINNAREFLETRRVAHVHVYETEMANGRRTVFGVKRLAPVGFLQ